MELKEIIKILKENLKVVVAFCALGGIIATTVIFSQPVKYQGNFSIYLNEAPSEKSLQNHNEFYVLESLGQISDLLVEWSGGRSFQRQELFVRLNKKTAVYLEGVLSAESEVGAKKGFDDATNMMTAKISELNEGIFANNKIVVSYSDFDIKRVEIDFWRYLGAGIFGGLMVGIFAVFAKFYFKEER